MLLFYRYDLLRHMFTTRNLENDGDIYTLQQILGHTSLEWSSGISILHTEKLCLISRNTAL